MRRVFIFDGSRVIYSGLVIVSFCVLSSFALLVSCFVLDVCLIFLLDFRIYSIFKTMIFRNIIVVIMSMLDRI